MQAVKRPSTQSGVFRNIAGDDVYRKVRPPILAPGAAPPAVPGQRQLQNQLQFNEGIIAERERDMADIQKSVTEVNEIFKDVARIVHEQQDDIDKIEETVGDSHTSAQAGLKEVKQAADMQSTCVVQ